MGGENDQLAAEVMDDSDISEKDISKVENVEEASNNYYNKLIEELFELRQKVSQEKLVNRELKAMKYNLQGRIESYRQRMDDLGLEELQNNMAKAKEELNSAKLELEELNHQTLTTSLHYLAVINSSTSEFEDLRFEYKNAASINRQLSLENDRHDQLNGRWTKLQEQIDRTEKAKKDLESNLLCLEGINIIRDDLAVDAEKTKQEIHVLRYQLQDLEKRLKRSSSTSTPP